MKKEKIPIEELTVLVERMRSAVDGSPSGSGSSDRLRKCSVDEVLAILRSACSVRAEDELDPRPKRPSEYFDIALGALGKSGNSPSEEEGMLRLIFEMGK
ncbi:hypothetical protein E3J62_05095, partial [candidate division TA06 bacterium]